MPMYEYKCKACGQSFDKLSSIVEKDEAKECPYCGKSDSEKMISNFLGANSSSSGHAHGLKSAGCGGG